MRGVSPLGTCSCRRAAAAHLTTRPPATAAARRALPQASNAASALSVGDALQSTDPSSLAGLGKAYSSLRQSIAVMAARTHTTWDEVAAITRRVGQETEARATVVDRELALCAKATAAIQEEMRPEQHRHSRRLQAQTLLAVLDKIKGQIKEARDAARKAKFVFEEWQAENEDEFDEGDPEFLEAKRKCDTKRQHVDSLLRRREGVLEAIKHLSLARTSQSLPAAPAPGGGGASAAAADAASDDETLQFDLPDIPVRADRTIKPFKKQDFSTMNAQQRAKHHMLNLLRRDGVYVDRSLKTHYSDESLPDAMFEATRLNNRIKGRRLRGVKAEAPSLKILKEYKIDEYKLIKRAIVTAHRLRHPGIMPIECAFLDGGSVYVQSRFCAGGNMQQWAPGKDLRTMMVAIYKVGQAIQFLHDRRILHRDIKPENIVFDSCANDAAPALCDFDLAMDTKQTVAATVMRGTVMFMAPEFEHTPMPSGATDVFAFGVTCVELLKYGSRRSAVPTTATQWGVAFDIDAAVKRLSPDDELDQLLSEMVAADHRQRPDIGNVVARLAAVLEILCRVDCLICMEAFPASQGVCCDEEHHFVCKSCFSDDVLKRQAPEMSLEQQEVKCSYGGCHSSPFQYQTIAQCCTEEAFAMLRQRMDQVHHAQKELEFEKKFKERERAILSMKTKELEVAVARKHIEEAIMTISCPRCKKAFVDFDGCAALVCVCKCAFCACCLKDCGQDAHAHVKSCPQNPPPHHGGYHLPEAVWREIMTARKVELLTAYWATLRSDIQEALACDAAVQLHFSDIGLLAPSTGAEFAAEIAQIKGRPSSLCVCVCVCACTHIRLVYFPGCLSVQLFQYLPTSSPRRLRCLLGS